MHIFIICGHIFIYLYCMHKFNEYVFKYYIYKISIILEGRYYMHHM